MISATYIFVKKVFFIIRSEGIELKKQNFIKGSIILMVSAAAAKVLGAVFKIPLTNMLGGVGMSYFSCAYSIFMPVYSLEVMGLSAAVARMTAQSAALGMYENVRRIRRTALLLFSAAGLAGSLLILLLAVPFSVYTVGNRNDPVYIVIDGSDNTGCYIKEGFSVPTSGTVTKVLVDPYVRGSNKKVVSKQEELNIVAELAAIEGEVQEFTVENYYTEGNAFYYVYDGSNVSTYQNYGGYIAYVNGCWIYSAPGMKIQIDQRVSNTAVVEAVIIKDPELLTGICKTDLVKWIKR